MTHPPVEPLVANRRDLRHRLSTRDAILIRRTLTAGLAINLLVPFFSGPLLLALMVHAHRRLRWSIQIGHLREASAKFKTPDGKTDRFGARSEEHTSELQSLMRISYAVFCLKKK